VTASVPAVTVIGGGGGVSFSLAVLKSSAPAATIATTGPGGDPAAGGSCPFLAHGLCSVHAIRPFGCRIFFCDPDASQWQQQAYERYHGRLKKMHEELKVPYHYVEWREALSAVGLTEAPHADPADDHEETPNSAADSPPFARLARKLPVGDA
jgi:hypothetical protein